MLSGHPPFKSASQADPWYGQLVKENYDKFWDVHEKKKMKEASDPIFYQAEFRNLINGMLHYDPVKRITIPEIKEHPWFKGPVLDNEELIKEFKDYRLIISQMLEKEKMERREMKKIAKAEAGGEGTFNAYTGGDRDLALVIILEIRTYLRKK